MARVSVPAAPRGFQRRAASAIRAPASAADLALHAQERVNWCLSQGASVVFCGAWPSSVTEVTSRIYHRRGVDADRLLVLAVIEHGGGAEAPGSLTLTPSGGTKVELTTTDDTATTPWGSPSWSIGYLTPTLVDTGLKYHAIEWTDMIVRSLLVLEIARDVLDSALSDVLVADRDGGYSGVVSSRMITEGSTGGLSGVPDILSAIASAFAATARHGGGVILPHALAWSTNSKTWANLADAALSTSGFGFLHRARQLRSSTTAVDHEVFIEARYAGGSGSGDARLRSDKGSDTVSFTGVTSSWAWHSPDSSALLAIAANEDDRLCPEGIVDDAGTTLEVASVQWVE